MIAFVVTTRFAQTPDGRLWNANSILGHSFWTRYLDVYDEVRLMGQAVPVERPPEGFAEATGPRVRPAPLPPIRGPLEMARHAFGLGRAVRRHLREPGALHLRAPSPLADAVWLLAARRRPYGVEVAGDPFDSLAPGAFRGRLRPLYRHWFRQTLRRECRHAVAAAYVTESALQRRYPPGADTFSTHFSSIDLRDEAFAEAPRQFVSGGPRWRIAYVGTLNQLYKAPHVLIDAVGICVTRGLNLELVLVGDGKYRSDLEERAGRRDVADRVRFAGHLPAGEPVRAVLDQADLFVLPSFQEGLPKAIIEAMARGLPCIGSTAGGIPELLHADDLVPPGDAEALADRIEEVLAAPERMNQMAARNLARARDYHIDVIRRRRVAFCQHVRDATERWLAV